MSSDTKKALCNSSEAKEVKIFFTSFKKNFACLVCLTILNNNIDVFSIKTDALTINMKDVDKAKELLHFGDTIGTWRVDKIGNDIRFPSVEFQQEQNKQIPTTTTHQENIPIQDEWNVSEICKAFEHHKHVMVRDDMPGSGKSFACKHLANNHKVLFVCPTNKLVQKYEDACNIEAVTVNRFFNLTLDNETATREMFDSSGYDVVVFDEIYFCDIRKLAKIKQFVETNPDKIIIATGDTSQLEPIDSLTNTYEYAIYADICINQILPYEIFLTENKRLKTQEQKYQLKHIKFDILNTSMPIMDTI